MPAVSAENLSVDQPTRELLCPVCRRTTFWKGNPDRPFCSERCKLIDLGAWVSEEYRVPGESAQSAMADDRNTDDEY
jgi:endogenous inhibitor of DNA gyrase (YacG/DUF329 family)